MTPAEFATFQSLVERRFGLFLNPEQGQALEEALQARMQALRLDCPRHYLRYLDCAGDEREARRLVSLLANTETHFLRVPEHFEVLRMHLIPALVRRGRRVIRIWSAACSTGQELYSIAMVAREYTLACPGAVEFDLLGTDLSDANLQTARAGYYSARCLRGLDGARIERYLVREGEGYRVKPELRAMVHFCYMNLMDHPLPFPSDQKWDIVFCRNVLLYFREAQACKVVAELEKVLASDGYLLAAPSESMRNLSSRLRVQQVGGVFIHGKAKTWGEGMLPNLRLPRLLAARRLPEAPPAPARPAAEPTGQQDYARCAALVAAGALEGQGLEEIERCCDQEPQQPQWALLLARACLSSGEAERAQRLCETLVEAHPVLAAAHFVLGLALAHRGPVRLSIEHYHRALYLDEDFFPAHYHLARAYRAVGDYRRARNAYRHALAVLERVPYASWQEHAEQFSYEEWVFACRQSLDAVECSLSREVAGLPA